MLPDKIAEAVKKSVSRTLRFYIPLKIHKPGCSGPLVVDPINSHTVSISKNTLTAT